MPDLKRVSRWLNASAEMKRSRALLLLTLTAPKTFTRVQGPHQVSTWQMPPGKYLMSVGDHPWDGPYGAPWLYFTNPAHAPARVGNSQGWLALAANTPDSGMKLRRLTLTEAFLHSASLRFMPEPHDGCPYEREQQMHARCKTAPLPEYERAAHRTICEDCGQPYRDHPSHPQAEWLTVLCSGECVKL